MTQEKPTEAPPALEDARNATFYDLEAADGEPIALADGKWEGEPFTAGSAERPSVNIVRDFVARGDVDLGGVDEIAVLLAVRGGGTGENLYVALVDRAGDAITNTATLLLGDRVQVRNVSVEAGAITAEVVQGGAGDPACCPGDLVRRRWELEDGAFTESGTPTVLGRLSPEVVGQSEWTLRWWTWEERAPDEPPVTLTYSEGRFAGNSGCNQYGGTVEAGELPGDIVLSPIMGTRMACPGPGMEVESRFLKSLEAATKIGFMAGDLMLTYKDDAGAIQVMLFEQRP